MLSHLTPGSALIGLVGLLLPSLSAAQLSGTLTSNPTDLGNMTATVTNPTNQNISVLAMNNLFDTAHRSLPVVLTQPNGTILRSFASTLHYDGIYVDDFLLLGPNQTFTRNFHLKEYVAPGVNWTSVSLHVRLPETVQGLLGSTSTAAGRSAT